MNKDEYNNLLGNELSNTNEFGEEIKNTIINNSENDSNNSYTTDTLEFGEDKVKLGNEVIDNKNIEKVASTAASFSVGAATSIVSTALVAIVGGITLATTTVTTEVELQIESITASAEYIDYEITTFGDTENMVLNISNGFDTYEVSLTEGVNSGTARNLKPNMDYTVTIFYNEGLFKKTAYKNVITTMEKKNLISDYNTFKCSYVCQCGVDGYFYFVMKMTDQLRIYSNFEASLTDNYGNTSFCSFTKNLYERQKIAIVNFDGNNNDLLGKEAVLKITCVNKLTDEVIVLYNENVEI